jgi:hypothetical protein
MYTPIVCLTCHANAAWGKQTRKKKQKTTKKKPKTLNIHSPATRRKKPIARVRTRSTMA